MPTVIELRLKATWMVRPDTRSLHGLACALFEGEAVRPGDHVAQEKPWAIAPLQPAEDGTPDEWILRAAWLPDSPPPSAQRDIESIRVGHTTCVVMETSQRRVTHAVLAASPPVRNVTVRFTSPAYFSRRGADVAVPDPWLIVGSWRRRWNASLPESDLFVINDEETQDLYGALGLSAFDLHTETRDSGHGKHRVGFTGQATLALTRDSTTSARQLLATLSRFAEYAGTGAQTTHGFGATTVIRS